MRDQGSGAAVSGGAAAASGLPSLEDVAGWAGRLAGCDSELTDAGRIDLVRALEVLKCAAEGAQAELTADFDASQRRAAARAGVGAERQGRGVASQVALARRESPYRGLQHVGFATVCRREMPNTWAALRAGRISQYQAMLLVRETACLELSNRQRIDQAISGDPGRVEAMGVGELVGEVHKLAYRLEPRSVTERRRRAEADRHTRLRPAPDTMSIFTALLSIKNGVAVQAVLGRVADRLRDAGDNRSRGQLMADLLVQRVVNPFATDQDEATGADADTGSRVPVMVNLVVSDTVLFGDDDGGGDVQGYGPVPGDLLREWIADHLDDEGQTVGMWVRRVYQTPQTGDLVAMDSTARLFTGKLGEFLRIRDRGCRTPWCDAPVRHLDHATSYAEGGATEASNGQGLCEACNYAKQAPGWHARPRPGPRHTVETTTPTGHVYTTVTERLAAAITAPEPEQGERERTDYRFPLVLAV